MMIGRPGRSGDVHPSQGIQPEFDFADGRSTCLADYGNTYPLVWQSHITAPEESLLHGDGSGSQMRILDTQTVEIL